MKSFFLSKQHHLRLDSLPDGRYYTKNHDFIVQFPHNCAPVWCEYTGDWTDHSWENPISGQVHTTHPLGFTVNSDNSFFDGFYEITEIKGLTFREGEAWDPDNNSKITVEKTDPLSIWNPFFQRYDPPCNKHFSCKGIQKEMESFSDCGSYLYFDKFTQCRNLFFDVYCNCGMRDGREHHTDSDSD